MYIKLREENVLHPELLYVNVLFLRYIIVTVHDQFHSINIIHNNLVVSHVLILLNSAHSK